MKQQQLIMLPIVGSFKVDVAHISPFARSLYSCILCIMYMLCFCTLCSYATCEWPEFYTNKDMFCSDIRMKEFSKIEYFLIESYGFKNGGFCDRYRS